MIIQNDRSQSSKLPSLDKEGRRWRQPARGGGNPGGRTTPATAGGHGIPLLNRGGELSGDITSVALVGTLNQKRCYREPDSLAESFNSKDRHCSNIPSVHHLTHLSLSIVVVLVLLGLRAMPAYSQTNRYALIASSVSGDEEFKEKFWSWSRQMYQSLREELQFPKENVWFLFEDPARDNEVVTARATKVEFSKVFEGLRSKVKQDDLIFIYLIGHGSFDGREYKFNLVGPDITGSELKNFLDDFPNQKIVLVSTTSCSGLLAKNLSQKNRVIVTSTKNEFENNDTIFAEFFGDAFKNRSADRDKNGRVSLLEAYLYSAQKVDAWYKERKRLATEHPLLEDNGDGQGTPQPSPENGEGLLAGSISLEPEIEVVALSPGAFSDPQLQSLYSSRRKLEATIQDLRYRKTSLPEAEYNKKMEQLLVQLAQTNQKIKSLEKKE